MYGKRFRNIYIEFLADTPAFMYSKRGLGRANVPERTPPPEMALAMRMANVSKIPLPRKGL